MENDNLALDHSALTAEFRWRNRQYDEQSITPGALPDYEAQGWRQVRTLKSGIRIRKDRTEGQILEDRHWCCLYRLGYPILNKGRNFRIPIGGTKKQIDVFAKDDETVVVAECKTAEDYKKKSLQKDLGEFATNKKPIADSIRKYFGAGFKPKIIWAFVTTNISMTDADLLRAREYQISIITDRELDYFEEIAKALGPAARQQFKAEYLPGLDIPALENVRIPATRSKIGGKIAYSFSCKASDILKIAFVNHRDLRDPTTAPTYQRLVNPNRLKKISTFLQNGGYFPTSILLNFQTRPNFDLALASDNKDIKFGYLTLPTRYKSVKVIDGQHRLYGCAVLPPGSKEPNLVFVAFQEISGTEEANLFATINKEQQKVQKRLLDALDGELKWEADDLGERIKAISSRALDLLNAKFGNPLEDKIVSPGLHGSEDRPLTLPEIRKPIISTGLIARQSSKGNWSPGPFYVSKRGEIDNLPTLNRLMDGLTWYFNKVKAASEERWERGLAGRICNNFGVPGHIRLLSELVRHIEKQDELSAWELSMKQLTSQLERLMAPVLDFIATANSEEFESRFNVKLGSGGIKQYYFALSQLTNEKFPEFKPQGFEQWLSEINKDEQEKADQDAKWIQEMVHVLVVKKLKEVYGEKFFDKAISNKEIQAAAYKKRLDDEVDERGDPEKYLDFLDLKKIVEQKENWPYFQNMFNIVLPDQRKGISKYIQWFDDVNKIRRVSAHPFQRTYSRRDLEKLAIIKKHLATFRDELR